MDKQSTPTVSNFRQIVLWPVQLIPQGDDQQIQNHWEYLSAAAESTAWKAVDDEFISETQFSDRRYREFVTFLPYAQSFLYGEGIRGDGDPNIGRSPVRVFYRNDVSSVRMTFGDDPQPISFKVDQVVLYFFYDIDIAIMAVEISGERLSLPQAMDTLFRFGRAYPTHWEPNGRGGHCAKTVEWLNKSGDVLSTSDHEHKEEYLRFVREHRVPRIARHWEFLMQPLVQHYSDQEGPIRYREIEYQRMPLMSFLAFDDLSKLTRADQIRIGMVTRPGDSAVLPFSANFLKDFESRYCYDRHWDEGPQQDIGNTRFMCNGQNFTVIGSAEAQMFTDRGTGMISQFRHQYFLLFLIAHFQKAALLMLSDRLVQAISRLDIDDSESVRQFRDNVRQTQEIFLRFTQRYWFHEVSEQAQSKDLFAMMLKHLETDDLFEKTRRRILDMSEFLDSDQLKRQAETVIRLTVVTAFGLIGTIATGVLGMNIFDETTNPPLVKLFYFMLVFIPVAVLVLYAIVKSKRLSVFLESLSDEKLDWREKWHTLKDVWAMKNRL
ncbi:MAG TPA: hypothetical protein DCF63_07155 [Planctomycetaceae bacterium]|nr:hypothetical protein [Planctomycetaceae bacterium]